MNFVTLHVRLTRDCNAHCSYCSSAGVSEGRMSVTDYKSSLDYIIESIFPKMGVGLNHFLTVEFLGGEILLVPEKDLEEVVSYTRKKIQPIVKGYRDGAQSNLIGSQRKIIALHDLFSGNLGTSWDNHTGQRHIKGSAELYRGILNRSLSALNTERNHNPGRVLVVDKSSAPFIEKEVSDAIEGNYDLVLRPVFQGGSQDVEHIEADELSGLLQSCYSIWSQKPSVRVEPFQSLFTKRISRGKANEGGIDPALRTAGCPFQSDCAFKSLSLDPDGALHICQEMADASHYPLGNAIDRIFDERTWRLLARRTAHLTSDCQKCKWRDECGGGCMNEAIETHGDPFAKTELCGAWKAIFRRIETDIESGRATLIEQEIKRCQVEA